MAFLRAHSPRPRETAATKTAAAWSYRRGETAELAAAATMGAAAPRCQRSEVVLIV